jgi:predicted outer membrane protein
LGQGRRRLNSWLGSSGHARTGPDNRGENLPQESSPALLTSIIVAARKRHACLPPEPVSWRFHHPNEDIAMSTRLIMRTAAGTLLLCFAFALCAQSSSPKGTMLVANAADSMFMTHAAADGMAEIQMGQMALKKSSDTKVKQLAQRIVDDHTVANEKLRILARDKQVDFPAAPSKDAQDKAAGMTAMDGAKFDQAWATGMVTDHQKAVALFSGEIKRPPIRKRRPSPRRPCRY